MGKFQGLFVFPLVFCLWSKRWSKRCFNQISGLHPVEICLLHDQSPAQRQPSTNASSALRGGQYVYVCTAATMASALAGLLHTQVFAILIIMELQVNIPHGIRAENGEFLHFLAKKWFDVATEVVNSLYGSLWWFLWFCRFCKLLYDWSFWCLAVFLCCRG